MHCMLCHSMPCRQHHGVILVSPLFQHVVPANINFEASRHDNNRACQENQQSSKSAPARVGNQRDPAQPESAPRILSQALHMSSAPHMLHSEPWSLILCSLLAIGSWQSDIDLELLSCRRYLIDCVLCAMEMFVPGPTHGHRT